MATATEIITEIRSWSQYDATTGGDQILPDTTLHGLMNEVADDLAEKYSVWFCLGTGTTVLSSGERAADLPATQELTRPVAVFTLSGSTRSYIYPLHYGEFTTKYLDDPSATSETDPKRHYAIAGSEIWISPTYSSDQTITIEGYYKAVPLSTNNDSNVFTVHAPRFLKYGTLVKMVEFGFEDVERLQILEREEAKARRAILAVGGNMMRNARRAKSRRKG